MRLEESIAEARIATAEVKAELASVVAEYREAQGSHARVRERLAERDREVAVLNQTLAELKIRIEEERHNTLEATAQVRAFQAALSTMEAKAATEADTFTKALDSARTDAGKFTSERNQALHAVDLSAKVIRDFQARIAALHTRAEVSKKAILRKKWKSIDF